MVAQVTCAVTPPLYSRSSWGCRCPAALVRQRQPLRQLVRGLVGRLAVERHHGRGHARSAAQLRPPPVADVRDLNLVRPSADSLFEAMNDHVVCCPGGVRGERRFYASWPCDQAKRDTKGASASGSTRDCSSRPTKNISLSGSPQVLHPSFTGFPQLEYLRAGCAS